MNETIRIASWNIAGARRMQSLKQFDYSGVDIEYFVNCLKEIDADIICLQESHTNDEQSVAQDIAALLGGMPFVYNVAVSPSHIDNAFSLGNAILSKTELTHIRDIQYPYPDFDLFFKDGRPAAVHQKMIQIYKYNNAMIANTQMLPLGIFGKSYASGDGARLAAAIEQLLLDNLTSPLIFCGDMNFDAPHTIYPNLYKQLELNEALPDTLTRPNKTMAKQTPDHIVISSNLAVIQADVVEVEADHYLCYADIIISD